MSCFYYFDNDRSVDLDISDDIRKTLFNHPLRLSNLAYRLHDKKVNFDEGVTLPVINLHQCEYTRVGRLFEKDAFIDFFSLGLFMFISKKLKQIFDLFDVSAFYSPVTIHLDDGASLESYYLFCPKLALDSFDYKNSIFSLKSDSDSRIDKIEKLVIDHSTVPLEVHLFMLANTSQTVRVISHELSDALISNHITGLTVKKIEDGSWMW